MKDYKIGDIVDINDVNRIKNALYQKECPPVMGERWSSARWSKIKRDIKKRVEFQIVAL